MIYDVIVVGGGHNGLISASYLAKAGKSVLLIEGSDHLGGASISYQAFPEHDVRLSRYSYLVSLLPDKIVKDLGIKFTTKSREISSYTPDFRGGEDCGLLVERNVGKLSEQSFNKLTGSNHEFLAWKKFYSEVESIAKVVAPTLLEPLPSVKNLMSKLGNDRLWNEICEQPIGQVVRERFSDDLVRGVVLTDALIGTFTSVDDLQANICFLYHLIGNGTGEWKVPVGGMGAFAEELERVAISSGVKIIKNTKIDQVLPDANGVEIESSTGNNYAGRDLIWAASPTALASALGSKQPKLRDGSQIKMNMLLKKLPELKSGVDPKLAFAGTFHINERLSDLEKAFNTAKQNLLPDVIPAEVYCHSITDPSIVGKTGLHTLTLFALHTPAAIFENERVENTDLVIQRILSGFNQYLVEPIETDLAENSDGSKCIEVKTPLDLEEEVLLPRGNIFHADLTMPFATDESLDGEWGAQSGTSHIYLGGAGAQRGGGVSGIPAHNAAMALLSKS
jgi:phytoene dehydrogenase-like protein